jgi:hypothetical protein
MTGNKGFVSEGMNWRAFSGAFSLNTRNGNTRELEHSDMKAETRIKSRLATATSI